MRCRPLAPKREMPLNIHRPNKMHSMIWGCAPGHHCWRPRRPTCSLVRLCRGLICRAGELRRLRAPADRQLVSSTRTTPAGRLGLARRRASRADERTRARSLVAGGAPRSPAASKTICGGQVNMKPCMKCAPSSNYWCGGRRHAKLLKIQCSSVHLGG